MKYGQDNDAAILRAEVDAVRETSGDDTANVLAHNGKLKWMFGRQGHATVDFGHELERESNPLAFLPRTGSDELGTGSAMKSDGQAHGLIWSRAAALTSFQGTTSSGLARWSARRRSSSVV